MMTQQEGRRTHSRFDTAFMMTQQEERRIYNQIDTAEKMKPLREARSKAQWPTAEEALIGWNAARKMDATLHTHTTRERKSLSEHTRRTCAALRKPTTFNVRDNLSKSEERQNMHATEPTQETKNNQDPRQ
jgi:hypothetical protein